MTIEFSISILISCIIAYIGYVIGYAGYSNGRNKCTNIKQRRALKKITKKLNERTKDK